MQTTAVRTRLQSADPRQHGSACTRSRLPAAAPDGTPRRRASTTAAAVHLHSAGTPCSCRGCDQDMHALVDVLTEPVPTIARDTTGSIPRLYLERHSKRWGCACRGTPGAPRTPCGSLSPHTLAAAMQCCNQQPAQPLTAPLHLRFQIVSVTTSAHTQRGLLVLAERCAAHATDLDRLADYCAAGAS